MMVNFGKSKVLERQMPQPRHTFIGRKLAVANLLEDLFDRFDVQRTPQEYYRLTTRSRRVLSTKQPLLSPGTYATSLSGERSFARELLIDLFRLTAFPQRS